MDDINTKYKPRLYCTVICREDCFGIMNKIINDVTRRETAVVCLKCQRSIEMEQSGNRFNVGFEMIIDNCPKVTNKSGTSKEFL